MQTRYLKTGCLSKPFIYASEVIVLILESLSLTEKCKSMNLRLANSLSQLSSVLIKVTC